MNILTFLYMHIEIVVKKYTEREKKRKMKSMFLIILCFHLQL